MSLLSSYHLIVTFDEAEHDVVEAISVLEVVLILHDEWVLQCGMDLHLSHEVLVVHFKVLDSGLDLQLLHRKDFLYQFMSGLLPCLSCVQP